MTGARYSRDRVASVLLKSEFPDCYRIIPARHAAKPLETVPADSRFCSRGGGYTVLYASPDFATAFVETVVRYRFTHLRNRKVALREVTQRTCVRVSAQPQTELTLLDLRGDGCTRIGVPIDAVRAINTCLLRALRSEH